MATRHVGGDGVQSWWEWKRQSNIWRHHLIVAFAVICVLSMSRAIGFEGDGKLIWNVFGHSLVLVAISYPLQSLFAYMAMLHLPQQLPIGVRAAVGCILAALPATLLAPIVSWVANVRPFNLPAINTYAELGADIGSRFPFVFFGFASLGTGLWLSMNLSWWITRFDSAAAADESFSDSVPEAEATDNPAFMAKLPENKHGNLIALSAERHYVRVYTSNGNDLVLMRFSDALDQCKQVRGVQVHRSHWISLGALQNSSDRRGRLSVTLSNGLTLPVSRNYRPYFEMAAKDMGLT